MSHLVGVGDIGKMWCRGVRVGSLLPVWLAVLTVCAFTNQAAAQKAYHTDAFCLYSPGVQQTATSHGGISNAWACIDKCRTATSPCRFATYWPKTKLCVVSSNCDSTRTFKGTNVYQVQQGEWGDWTFQPCTKTCGTGARVGTRKCLGESGSCPGKSTTAEACNTSPCPKAPSWSAWSFTTCSLTCGGGVRTGTRTCTKAGMCPGTSTRTENCNTASCPTWTSWAFTSCSATCGGGVRTGTRTCTGGPTGSCVGSSTTTENCNTDDCPGNCPTYGKFEDWSDWSPCCSGLRGRVRKCSVNYVRTGFTTPDTSKYHETKACTSLGTEKCGKLRAYLLNGTTATLDLTVGVTAQGEMRLAYAPTDINDLVVPFVKASV